MRQICCASFLGRLLLAVSLISYVALPSASARKKRKAKNDKDAVAIFIIAKGKPNAKIYGTIATELAKANEQFPSLKFLWGRSLKRLIKRKPDAAIKKCGSNIKCVAKLGARARAGRVLYARAQPSDNGVMTQFLIVNVASQEVDKRAEMEVTTAGNVGPVLAAKLDEMLATGTAAAHGGGEEEISLDTVLEEPPLEIAMGPSEEEAEPDAGHVAPTGVAVVDEVTELLGEEQAPGPPPFDPGQQPDAGEPGAPDDPVLGLTEPKTATEIAAIGAGISSSSGAATSGPASSGDSMLLTYAGIGVAGVGVAALGAGGYFGMQSSSKRDEIQYGPGGTTQLDASDINNEANELASRANLMYGVGGGLVLVGATLVVLDLMLLGGGGDASTSVSVGASASSIVVGWEF